MANAPIGDVNKMSETGKKYIAPKEPQASAIRWAFHELARERFNTEQIWKMAREKGLTCGKNNFWNGIRNPVYYGKILVPKHKDEEVQLVEGQHEALISEDLFYRVKDVLDGRGRIYRPTVEIIEELPLRGFLICPTCGKTLTGSVSKGRNKYYHYYHCISSYGFRHRAEDINSSIIDEIRKYVKPLPKLCIYRNIITEIFKAKTKGQRDDVKLFKIQLEKANRKLAKARDLLLEGDIEGDDYRIIKMDCEKDIMRLEARITATASTKFNINPLLDKAIGNLSKLDILYQKGTTAQKRRIIGSIFPEKLIFDGSRYRTTRVNEAITLILFIDKELRKIKNWTSHRKLDLSSYVGPTGFEPVTLPTG
ncbi:recombinase family protein [Sinomicrobium sp. M5D2P9]